MDLEAIEKAKQSQNSTLSEHHGKIVSTCQICKSEKSKYRCPACLQETCSLPCVNRHKEQTGCSGNREKAAYVKLTQFTDINLLSDYRFLEDANRTADNANRDTVWKRSKKPRFLFKLEERSKALGIDLRVMPYPMTRRKQNKTRIYNMNSKESTINWQVEWVFPESDISFRELLPFDLTLKDALLKHLHPTESEPLRRHTLRSYVAEDVENLQLFIQQEGLPANKIRYHRLQLDKTMTENLSGKVVVEYPTVYVVLQNNSAKFTNKLVRKNSESSSSEEETSDSSSEESSSEEEEESEEEEGELKEKTNEEKAK